MLSPLGSGAEVEGQGPEGWGEGIVEGGREQEGGEERRERGETINGRPGAGKFHPHPWQGVTV